MFVQVLHGRAARSRAARRRSKILCRARTFLFTRVGAFPDGRRLYRVTRRGSETLVRRVFRDDQLRGGGWRCA